ncbi:MULTISPECIES: YezD family protein [Brevibacillus]|jgi:hypothetical protein|uniref:DUF2292 domain-containing protein n=1 Tax=Brevibacillus parabrevis TaxID=54914 RepID=A0A4Y3PPC7_BREPA|nr:MULTISPECIES: YezD family protein [Brevibacillus]TGV29682.1 DUF2292 domain-containing protein [Mesorhizobium sp. M00.F.Ca.ET.186.01.1.1]KZE47135.1 hypothetical protein AV540_20260 [Brevibacillus parabrevis]MBU8714212.1 YezD family protein [Brevibacillus parabrevis]MDH6350329.1 hypothetical protein [Brevibacillus sp. 1238]MDR5001854.1 YezD family protein [Brevibacillus parabrevis]
MAKKENALNEQLWEKIERALDSLEFGSIHIVVHDSQVVQIERTEKYRLPAKKEKEEGQTTQNRPLLNRTHG